MATRKREERRRTGSGRRQAQHRTGGDWTSLSIPEGVDLFQPKGGKAYRIDLVPYKVGEGNKYADPGEWYYERTFWVHRIGPNNSAYVCPAKTFDQPCPVCEYRAKLLRDPDADQKAVDAKWRDKERQLFLVRDRDDESKGVQLWEFSHFCFGALLDKLIKDAEEDEDYVRNFDDPEGGACLKVSFNDEKVSGYSFAKAYSIQFKPRSSGLPDELLDHGICLDDLVKVESYDKLKEIMFQAETGDEEKSTATADEAGIEVGDYVQHEKLGGPLKVVRISRDGTSLTLEDEDGDEYKAIGVAEVETLDDVTEEELPKKSKSSRRKPEHDPEPDDDDGRGPGDDEPKKVAGTRAKAKAKAKKAPVAEDEDWDEWD